MSTIEEKRVYADRASPTPVYVAAEQGLVVARLSGDIVGEFSLARRGTCADVAVRDGTLVVAGEDAVLVAPNGTPTSLVETGFGLAVAVGLLQGDADADQRGHVVAAAESGRVAALPLSAVGESPAGNGERAGGADADDWTTLGTVEEPRAIDGSLLAGADGVYRLSPDGLTHSGLAAVNDVASTGAPLAATDEALYDLGNGWMVAREGRHVVVDTDGQSANAVTADGDVVGRVAGSWEAVSMPTDARVVGFGYAGGSVVAATESGSVLVDAGEGWRSRALGVTGVRAVAVDDSRQQ
jgi:hypothetical protein